MRDAEWVWLGKKPAGWLLALNLLLSASYPQPAKPHQAPEPVESKKKESVHVVRKGETLSRIARLHGVSLRALIEVNQLTHPHTLRVGQRLLIPEPERQAVGSPIPKKAAPIRPAGPPAHFVFSPRTRTGQL